MYALYALYNRYMIRPVTLGHSDLNPLKRKVLFGDPWTLLMPCRRSRDLQSLAYRIRTRYFPPSYNTDIGCHSTRAQHGWELLATRSVSDAAAGEHPVLNTGPAPVE